MVREKGDVVIGCCIATRWRLTVTRCTAESIRFRRAEFARGLPDAASCFVVVESRHGANHISAALHDSCLPVCILGETWHIELTDDLHIEHITFAKTGWFVVYKDWQKLSELRLRSGQCAATRTTMMTMVRLHQVSDNVVPCWCGRTWYQFNCAE